MIFRAAALDNPTELSARTRSRQRSIWPTLIACLLILHASLVLSELLQGVAWLAWVECVVASMLGLSRLRETGSEPEVSFQTGAAVGLTSLAASPRSSTQTRT
jgi:hypothetical protein